MHTSTKWLVGLIVLSAAIPVLQGFLGFPMFLPYEWHKALHIFGAVLLLGNIIVTGMWMLSAERTRNEAVIRFGLRITHWADVWFTAPGTILLLVNGLVMAERWGGLLNTNWIMAAVLLFILSGIIWTAFLIPVQNWFVTVSHDPAPLPAKFYPKLRQWYFWGSVATILPVVSMFLMVLKPF